MTLLSEPPAADQQRAKHTIMLLLLCLVLRVYLLRDIYPYLDFHLRCCLLFRFEGSVSGCRAGSSRRKESMEANGLGFKGVGVRV